MIFKWKIYGGTKCILFEVAVEVNEYSIISLLKIEVVRSLMVEETRVSKQNHQHSANNLTGFLTQASVCPECDSNVGSERKCDW